MLDRWADVFRDRPLWLRIDLGRGDGHHEKVRTGGSEAKFGLPMAKAGDFVEAARGIGARVVALHAHLGSGIDNVAHWREVYADLAALAEQIGTVETIDIGGGLPVPYTPDARPFDVAGWAEGLAGIKAAYPRFALAIEPGRYLVAEAGVLLARVTQVVEKDGVRRIGLDAGMNALVRPAMYDAWHAIHNLSRLDDDGVLPFDVVGPICESSDVFGHARMLPAATQEGDVVLIADAGAYGMAMASTYNLRALPLEEVVG
jgi:diaminopimelate decarboxylase/aspartate kinase